MSITLNTEIYQYFLSLHTHYLYQGYLNIFLKSELNIFFK